MEDNTYTPPKTDKTFHVSVDKESLQRPPKVAFRQPLQLRGGGGGGGGGGVCNDGADGQDGAQTDCSGDCHAYFA